MQPRGSDVTTFGVWCAVRATAEDALGKSAAVALTSWRWAIGVLIFARSCGGVLLAGRLKRPMLLSR